MTEVDICNLALAHLGDSATVASISPPEATKQAQDCARFYPIARNSLLEMHAWGFATVRASLSLLSNTWPEWDYCYAQPSDAVNLLAVLPPDATDDVIVATPVAGVYGPVNLSVPGVYQPQPYVAEALPDGTEVIYTDQPGAVLRYTKIVTDVTKFSPLFVDTLSWWLAGYLAGPLLKGEAGRNAAIECRKAATDMLAKATVSDANQRNEPLRQSVSWVAGR